MLFFRKKIRALVTNPEPPRYWKLVWQRFRKNKMALWAFRGLLMLIAMAILGPFLANEKPLYAKIHGQHSFPIFKQMAVQLGWSTWGEDLIHADWVGMDYESVIRPPIPYSPTYIDKNNNGKSPFGQQVLRSPRFRHWLGTDELGRDVAAGMIQGARISLMVGFVTMFIATLIGLFFGAVAGYFGDGKLQLSRARVTLNFIGLLLGFYYAFGVRTYLMTEGEHSGLEWLKRIFILFVIILLSNGLVKLLERFSFFGKQITVGVDIIIMRFTESLNTIPGMFLILAMLPLFASKSVFNIMLILALISWMGIAQFVRGEMLRVRNLQYVEAARALGYSSWRIIRKHALPNALTPVLIVVAFGMAGAVLAESTLSFLGLGGTDVTWGTLLAKGRNHISYWWLTVLPGLAIFLTVTFFNLIGDGLSEALK
jgi:peptide/nickel transport system permease protein